MKILQLLKNQSHNKEIFRYIWQQPSRGVLRKRCSENMQQIYRRRTPMSKCEFNKLYFGMGLLLYIKFAACIFSEDIFLRTPLDGCVWYRLLSTLSSCIWNGVNLHVMETKWGKKIHIMAFLKKGGRDRNKTSYTNRIMSDS